MNGWTSRVPALVLMLLASAPALAQTAEPTPASNEDGDAPTQLAPLEVTAEAPVALPYLATDAGSATKTGTPIIETPASVSVITADLLRDRGAQTLQDALRYSAGVMADAYGLDNRTDSAILRGTEFQSVLDGLRDQFNYYNVTRPDTYALERVELLRGPASVLYGQGPSAGIVSLVSKRPQAEAAREIGVEYGRYNRRRVQADSTGPLTEDGEWLYRVVGVLQRSDSQVDSAFYDRELLSPSLTWKPSDTLEWTLLATYQRDDSRNAISFLPHSGTILPNPNGQIPVNRYTGEASFDRFEATKYAATSLLQWTLSDVWSLHQNLRYADNDNPYYSIYPDVFSNPANPFLDDSNRTVARYVYAELRDQQDFNADHQAQARFATGAVDHHLLLGLDYVDTRYRSRAGYGYLETPFDLFDPVYGTPVETPELGDPNVTRSRFVGVYAQDQIKFGPHWIAVLGLRHDESRVKPRGSDTARERATTGRAGLMYQTTFGLAPYVSYSESFQPNVDVNPDTGDVFDPMRGEQLEIGLKYQPDGGDTLLTATAYQLKENNRVFYDLTDFTPAVTSVESQGVELEAITRVGALDLTASYTYIDLEKRRQYFAVQPRHIASLWGRYRWNRFEFGAGARYLGATTDDGGTLRIPVTMLFDAMVAYDWEAWRVALNATNLEDETYVTSCLQRGDCFYGNRGTLTGAVTYRF